MAINNTPSSYLVMDTCCFLNYIQGKSSDAFNYQKIEQFVKNNRWKLLITPDTLWESIQTCTQIERIKERREEMLRVGNLYVMNMGNVLNNEYALVPVKTCIENIGFNPDTLYLLAQKRGVFREKVYSTLYPKIITIAQLIAIVYLTICERKEDGTYSEGFEYRKKEVLRYFKNHHSLKIYLERFLNAAQGLSYYDENGILQKPLDAKDYLKDELESMVKTIMIVSRVREEHRSGINPYANNSEFEERIYDGFMHMDDLYKREDMRACYKAFLKAEPKRTADVIVEEIGIKGPELLQHMYKKLVMDWMSANGLGKPLMNTIIDYSNMDFLFSPQTKDWVYITEEDKIIEELFSTHDPECEATRDFYKQFYLGSFSASKKIGKII